VLGIEGYRGVIERMYRSGAVAKVVVREVCARDKFRYVEGADDKPVHAFGGQGETGADFFGPAGSRDRGAMVGVYAYAELTNGAVSRVVILNRADWEAARDAGGYKPDDPYSPWNRLDAGKDHPEFRGRSMVWKTAAKRLEPWVPTSAEYRREMLRASAAAADAAGPRLAGPVTVAAQENGQPPAEPYPDVQDAEIVGEPDAPCPPELAREVNEHLKRLGVNRALATVAWLAGHDGQLAKVGDLTGAEARTALAKLEGCGTPDDLGALLAAVRDDDAGAEASDA
jgi:recombination protein RecT